MSKGFLRDEDGKLERVEADDQRVQGIQERVDLSCGDWLSTRMLIGDEHQKGSVREHDPNGDHATPVTRLPLHPDRWSAMYTKRCKHEAITQTYEQG